MTKELKVTETEIPGLLIIDLPVHGDNRGWFKENWQRERWSPPACPTSTRCRTTFRSTLRWVPPAVSTPSPGTSTFGCDRSHLRRMG